MAAGDHDLDHSRAADRVVTNRILHATGTAGGAAGEPAVAAWREASFSGDSGAEDIVAGQGQARRRAGEQLAAEWCAVCCSKYMCGSGPAMCTPG